LCGTTGNYIIHGLYKPTYNCGGFQVAEKCMQIKRTQWAIYTIVIFQKLPESILKFPAMSYSHGDVPYST
jgi:hypothetical protein